MARRYLKEVGSPGVTPPQFQPSPALQNTLAHCAPLYLGRSVLLLGPNVALKTHLGFALKQAGARVAALDGFPHLFLDEGMSTVGQGSAGTGYLGPHYAALSQEIKATPCDYIIYAGITPTQPHLDGQGSGKTCGLSLVRRLVRNLPLAVRPVLVVAHEAAATQTRPSKPAPHEIQLNFVSLFGSHPHLASGSLVDEAFQQIFQHGEAPQVQLEQAEIRCGVLHMDDAVRACLLAACNPLALGKNLDVPAAHTLSKLDLLREVLAAASECRDNFLLHRAPGTSDPGSWTRSIRVTSLGPLTSGPDFEVSPTNGTPIAAVCGFDPAMALRPALRAVAERFMTYHWKVDAARIPVGAFSSVASKPDASADVATETEVVTPTNASADRPQAGGKFGFVISRTLDGLPVGVLRPSGRNKPSAEIRNSSQRITHRAVFASVVLAPR